VTTSAEMVELQVVQMQALVTGICGSIQQMKHEEFHAARDLLTDIVARNPSWLGAELLLEVYEIEAGMRPPAAAPRIEPYRLAADDPF
jgi:hypothetical protein